MILWFWVTVVVAVSIYTLVTLASDARIRTEPNATYGERFSAGLVGWSTSIGFFVLGDFVGTSAVYQLHGHLVDWELVPFLYRWPVVLMELVVLTIVGVILASITALIPPRIKLPWLVIGLALLVLGGWHGAVGPVAPP